MRGVQALALIRETKPVFGDENILRADRIALMLQELAEITTAQLCPRCGRPYAWMDERDIRSHLRELEYLHIEAQS